MNSSDSVEKTNEIENTPTDNNGRRLKKIISILVKHDITKGLTPEKLRLIIEDLGPTFIKIGQIMSMRRDIFPNDYCLELEKLRSQVTPMPYNEFVGIIEDEYSFPATDVFKAITHKPLGSASIAQVHAAELLDGSKVVIKVQRPGIYQVMAQDVVLLNRATGILNIASGIGDVVDFKMIVDEMWSTAQQEMDFLYEAKNAQLFNELNTEIKYIGCPKIYNQYTTSKVLVMENIMGIEIDEKIMLLEAGYDLEEIGTKLAENYVKQIIDDGFFHADPHPGNIFIRDGQIVWIDLGMMGKLSKREMGLLRRSVKAVATRDVEGIEGAILSLGVHKGRRINHSLLYEAIDRILDVYGTEELSNINMGRFLEEILKIATENHIGMPRGISMLSRGMITIEGVIADISPEANFVRIMANHMSGQQVENFDLKTFVETNTRKMLISGEKAISVPGQISDFLSLANKGQIKLNLEVMGSEEPLAEIDQMVNKIIICIINAALLIGSSFIATTDMTPKFMGIPALGALGYFTAIILSLALMISIHRKKRKR
ncbi:ABC1 kinase family protein [Acetobacterium woodii]|uniref:Protein kinase n=1 Tax=Acetobacterium woodii (strain ATCC 29683 / DSM 1030 / JCM 2381 / KCTC 1655 / WB1) TaxID=931626 RepID=H6LCS8_ACEWD|nr:AarF/UbiB family protein [Acetobacterium woodii]AFA49065.1 protein kinase [Acetobacterium woodii DSM 1030]